MDLAASRLSGRLVDGEGAGRSAVSSRCGRRVKIQRFSPRFALVAGFWLYILRSKGILAHSI